MARDQANAEFEHYSGVARFFHWVTVVFVFGLLGSGLVMVYRGKDLNIWDGLTNSLYASHKTAGIALLVIVVLRLVYRLVRRAPADEPTLHVFHRVASHATHWTLYALLVALPLIGWYGVSLFPALNILGGYNIPALVAPDQAASKQVLWLHGLLAYVLIALIAMHIGAALYHHAIRRDNVLRRMIPSLKR